jgi:transcriptional regulator with XRE-family HTH domain
MELGLLQREVARFIGVDESTIWNWEANGVPPSPRYLARVCEFLSRGPESG